MSDNNKFQMWVTDDDGNEINLSETITDIEQAERLARSFKGDISAGASETSARTRISWTLIIRLNGQYTPDDIDQFGMRYPIAIQHFNRRSK